MRRLLEWKYMNPQTNMTNNSSNTTTSNNSSTGSFPSQETKYRKLLAQLAKENRFSYIVDTLTDNALVFNLIDTLNNDKTTNIAIVYKPYTSPPVWQLSVNNKVAVDYKDWNELLEVFEIPGIIKDISSLKESLDNNIPSIVEDFETYNNLWSK